MNHGQPEQLACLEKGQKEPSTLALFVKSMGSLSTCV